MSSVSVIVYSQDYCQPCRIVKKKLDDAGLDFQEVNLSTLPTADSDALRERFKADGHMQSPVVYWATGADEGEMSPPHSFSGLNPYELDELLSAAA